MKKFICAILCVVLLLSIICVNAEEEGILVHGYISPFNNYYIAVPAEWSIIGAGSTSENLTQASEELEVIDVYGLYDSMNEKNDVLICLTNDNIGMTLTYGTSSGVSNDELINNVEEIKKKITEEYGTVTFSDSCGAFKFNTIAEILYIGMTYKNTAVNQFYMISGSMMYIFTFYGVGIDMCNTVMSTFSLVETEAE